MKKTEKAKKTTKTTESARRAINKYNSKFDHIMVRVPKGTADMIRELGFDSVTSFAREAIYFRLAHPEYNYEPNTDSSF